MAARLLSDAMRAYYDARAGEYDDWWLGSGLFAARERPGWDEEVAALVAALAGLPAARVLDVACGSGFLTRHLRGEITAVDQSPAMVALAAARMPGVAVLEADASAPPFADGAFDRVFTGHFYGHLLAGEREAFLAEARRLARELVVVDSALRPGVAAQEWQERALGDRSRHLVYKRYFEAAALAAELGGGEVRFEGTWFVAVEVRWG